MLILDGSKLHMMTDEATNLALSFALAYQAGEA